MNLLNTQRLNGHLSMPTLGRYLLGLVLAGACISTAQAQARYSYSTDGAEVTDSKTGLIWQRCSAGQSWDGSTCNGTAATYTHEAALSYAKTQAQAGWRLPNVKELFSITDKTRSNPAIDVTAFPATPPSWYWSASPYAGDAADAWLVLFYYGGISYGNRGDLNRVRLVR
ncbi:DUF1566 domain-containing protein [Rhodoferax sp.]|uniref:Lcl C-terminal domain-containing protein n=1 Tax=Rhodoferax sp. TaxID=50421 RepID=UPI0019E383C5|nr:DUF1566 domain-containing protein [Rhodoferax sp.]MBE0473845.1 DUF1566 domain-containing protein [Rhodoferax sp.]